MAAGTWNLAKVLGIIAGLLAWTAALIRYLKDGEVNWGLIAAGVFIASLTFIQPKPKGPPAAGDK